MNQWWVPVAGDANNRGRQPIFIAKPYENEIILTPESSNANIHIMLRNSVFRQRGMGVTC